jgi:precorrin-6Y C5,15-methyltransferase (decarboxylating)
MTALPLIVVGIGQDGPAGLSPEARAHVERAEMLAGGKRHLAFFPTFAGEKIVLESDVASWIAKLQNRDRHRRTVVLATGDPLFYGIGRPLLEAFPKEELLFFPHVSSVALAFARLRESWQDACVVSLHGRPIGLLRAALHRGETKIAVFTDAHNHPAAIAGLLRDEGLADEYVLWVCEDLGSTQERITRYSPATLKHEEFAPLNLVVLLAERAGKSLPLVGLPESVIAHRGGHRGMITKREVRLQALSQLELHAGDVFWDIGAGSGSVSLEAARLSPRLAVFAIEPDAQQLRANLDYFGLANISLIEGEAPEVLGGLPDPDAVFVGGSGGRLLPILEEVVRRLRPGGRLVLSCITLETFSRAWNWLSERSLDPQATSIQLAHSRPLGSLHSLAPEPPIFFVRIVKSC